MLKIIRIATIQFINTSDKKVGLTASTQHTINTCLCYDTQQNLPIHYEKMKCILNRENVS